MKLLNAVPSIKLGEFRARFRVFSTCGYGGETLSPEKAPPLSMVRRGKIEPDLYKQSVRSQKLYHGGLIRELAGSANHK